LKASTEQPVAYYRVSANHISTGTVVRMLLPDIRKENTGRKIRGQENEEKRTRTLATGEFSVVPRLRDRNDRR
jgi:hypothetical protein